jgi:putative transcriptional regulator
MKKHLESKDSIVDSLKEVLEDVKGIKKLKSRTVIAEDINVYDIREKYHLTQLEFSKRFGFSLRTLQQWEQGRRKPHGSARILLKVIEYAPEVVNEALRETLRNDGQVGL